MFLIDVCHWSGLQKICGDMKQKLEESTAQSGITSMHESFVLCDLGLSIAEIMLVITAVETQQGKL